MTATAGAVHEAHPDAPVSATARDGDHRLEHLQHAIEHAAHLLPAQGPITVFIHHNTLHAFEDLPFDEGVQAGAKVFGCHPYLPEERYRSDLSRGRIRLEDLVDVLREDLEARAAERLPVHGTRFDLQLAMLQYPLRFAPDVELRWFIADTDALNRIRSEAPPAIHEQMIETTRHWVMRDVRDGSVNDPTRHASRTERGIRDMLADLFQQFGASSIETWDSRTWEAFSLHVLWRICRHGVHGIRTFDSPVPPPVRHRDLLWEVAGADTDRLINEPLIRFCAAFLDQGFTHWHLPYRELGFYRAFCKLYRQPVGPPDAWLHGLSRELGRLEDAGIGPLDSILESFDILGIDEPEWESFISATLLALRGWAGMIQQVEIRSDSVAHAIPQGSLVEFLAIRLILKRLALTSMSRQALGREVPLNELRRTLHAQLRTDNPPTVDQRAFVVFQLAQVLGWFPQDLSRLNKHDWSTLLEEIEKFSSMERRRIFHRAFERRFRNQTLDALAIHARRSPERVSAPRFQAMFCLDEREESIRRHLEEVAPEVETFSAAGFFSIAMYYRGTDDAHFVPLCPVVIRPQHWVVENVVYTLGEVHRQRAKARRALGTASHQFHVESRGLAGGAVLTAGLGVLASLPLVARILFPRLTARIRRTVGHLVRPPKLTQLQLERTDVPAGPEQGHLGFTVQEMANVAERLLRDTGLTSGFARLVLVIGHGSNSLNNPHKSAYDCGACGGSSGGPNGRAMAQIMNDPRVREILAGRGLPLPHETRFVGGFHNTCDDKITLFDLDRIPPSHWEEFEAVEQAIDATCDRNAHERCRRFVSAPLTMSFSNARRHVEERSEDLAQTRPECGHASNAICIVGRRSRTRGLYLDRRSFLTSYDPTQDDAESSVLARILAAAVPVCAGINLEYYFSYVDSYGWGCGTKLPHNVTSLLGVMDGAASDLRTGLPWQMVEIHEPVRLLFVIETTPAAMLSIMDRNPGIGKLCRNAWIQLAVLDPNSSRIQVFHNGAFHDYTPRVAELPKAKSSADWYRGWRDNLEFAQIES